MASQILRRIVQGALPSEIIRRVNAVIDMLNGNQPGRINLDGDDGAKLNPIGGASISTGNHALRVRAASGEHVLVRNAANSADLLEVDDTSGVSTANLSVGGNLTFVGTSRRILADLSNATAASKLLVQSSTVNGTTDFGVIPNGTSVISSFSAFNNATPASATVQAMLRVNASAVQIRSESPGGSYQPIEFILNTARQAGLSTAGVFDAAALVAGTTARIGTEVLYAAGNALLSNASYLNGRNAAGSAVVNLLRINGSDVIESGQTGTRHNLLGTVVAPDIDPPTVNGQVTQRAVAAAWAYFTVAGGAVTLRDSYNVTSVTYNAAGDYTVTWDRDFSSAYYACLPSVEDNGAVLLAPKVNSQAAGSADIWVYNVAAAKTDPDAVSVVCFGTLS